MASEKKRKIIALLPESVELRLQHATIDQSDKNDSNLGSILNSLPILPELPDIPERTDEVRAKRQLVLEMNNRLGLQNESITPIMIPSIPTLQHFLIHLVAYCNNLVPIIHTYLNKVKVMKMNLSFGLHAYTPKKLMVMQVHSSYLFIKKLVQLMEPLIADLNSYSTVCSSSASSASSPSDETQTVRDKEYLMKWQSVVCMTQDMCFHTNSLISAVNVLERM
jgi:hypothetical protein